MSQFTVTWKPSVSSLSRPHNKHAAVRIVNKCYLVTRTVARLEVVCAWNRNHSSTTIESRRRRFATSRVRACCCNVRIASSIAWEVLIPLSFNCFRILSDSSLTVMLYWFAIVLLQIIMLYQCGEKKRASPKIIWLFFKGWVCRGH